MRKSKMQTNTSYDAWNDSRFIKLSELTKEPIWYGLGAMNAIWKFCQDTEKSEITIYEANYILKKRGLLNKIIETGLITVEQKSGENTLRKSFAFDQVVIDSSAEKLLKVSGMRDRLNELIENREKRKESGRQGGIASGLSRSKNEASASANVKQNEPSLSMSLSLSKTKTDPSDQSEERIRQQSRRALSPDDSADDFLNGNAQILNEPEFVESEIVQPTPKKQTRKKKAIETSDHDRDLGHRWHEWTMNLSPHINATPTSFAAAIFETKRALARTIPNGDLDALMDALFAFIMKDKFWGKNCLSPAGLLKQSANGLRKVDNIIKDMRGSEFREKQRDLISKSEGDTDWSKYI